jgi:hypothetical protein
MLALFLSLPSLTLAGDSYNDELRLLDLELEMLSLKSQMLSQQRSAIEDESQAATRDREQRYRDIERDISQSYSGRYKAASPVLELDHITVLDPEPLFPTMRPPWLQPADRLAPMPEEQRARMWCVVSDCWLNQTPQLREACDHLRRQSSPKRCDQRLIFGVAALRAFQDYSPFFVSVFHLSDKRPFNHFGVALFTSHGCLHR